MRNLEQYAILARSLVEAYRSGEDAALGRVMDHFHLRRRLTWDQPSKDECIARLRRGMRERLDVQSELENESDTLPLADAQLLVARSLGFKNWDDLVNDVDRVTGQAASSGLLGWLTEHPAYPNGCCPEVEGVLCRVQLLVSHA